MANIDQVQLPDGSQYHIIDDTSGYATTTYVQDQISTINKNTIGLGNVDNTADINKPVSLPQQTALDGKVDDDIVAYVENDTTATKRHEVGDQFILNGVLYTATAIIAVNDTIVIGTNCDSAESVATQITENANAIVSLRSDITSINQTGTTATQAISSGTYFYLNGTLVRAKTDIASGATFTENTNYEIPTDGGLNQTTANRCLMADGTTVQSRLTPRKVAGASANQTWNAQLTSLQTAYNALTDEEKKRSYIIHTGSTIARCINADYGTYSSSSIISNAFETRQLSISFGSAFVYNGSTVTDIKNNSDAQTIELWV